MMRKIFFIVLIVSGLVAIFLAGRFLYEKRLASNQNGLALAGNSLINRFVKPEEKRPKSTDIVESPPNDGRILYSPPGSSDIYYYLPANGQIKNDTQLIAEIMPNLVEVVWSPRLDSVVGKDSQGFIFFDLKNNTSRVLEKEIKELAYSKNSQFIAYYSDKDGETGIALTNSQFQGKKTILKTHAGPWNVEWVNENTLRITKNSTAFLLDVGTENLTQILPAKTLEPIQDRKIQQSE